MDKRHPLDFCADGGSLGVVGEEVEISKIVMNQRQKDILTFVINEYIRTAQPVASSLLREKAGLDLSPATYRNELAQLEQDGFLTQPHTSAGRIPTEAAYKLYVEECLDKRVLKGSAADLKVQIHKDASTELLLKNIAKEVVDKAEEAVFIAFDKQSVYYTGLAQLFSQPEFKDHFQIVSISAIVDHLDEVIDRIYDEVSDLEVLIGSSNPFGNACSTIIGKYKTKDKREGMFGILGPLRMDYAKNIHLIEEVKKLVGGIGKG